MPEHLRETGLGVRLRAGVFALGIALPALNPAAAGPSPSVIPLLVSAACIVAMLLVRLLRSPQAWLLTLCLAFCVALLAANGAVTDRTAAIIAVCAMMLCAAIGAGATGDALAEAALAHAWLFAAAITALIGLAQFAHLDILFTPLVDAGSEGRAYGNFRQPNQFASWCVIGIAALRWRVQKKGLHAGALAIALVLGLATAASASRTGLLEACVLCALAALWTRGGRREPALVCVTALAGLLVGALVLPWLARAVLGQSQAALFDRIASPAACESRATLWHNVVDLIRAHPWRGWGWGELDFAHFVYPYAGDRFCDILDNAHNLPLHLAVELGIPVALVVMALLAWKVATGGAIREQDPTRQLAWAVLAIIGLHSMLEYPLWYGPFIISAGLSLGILWPARAEPSVTVSMPTPAQLVFALVAACGVAYAAWDYHRVAQVFMAPEERDAASREDPLKIARHSWLFQNQVQFAELTTTPLTRANARWTHEAAMRALHYSPEPRVIEKVIESDLLLGNEDEARTMLERYRVAFPDDHAQWAAQHGWPGAKAETGGIKG